MKINVCGGNCRHRIGWFQNQKPAIYGCDAHDSGLVPGKICIYKESDGPLLIGVVDGVGQKRIFDLFNIIFTERIGRTRPF